MSDRFLAHWFQGFNQSLSALDERGVDALMTNCGRACSESFSRQIYMEQYEAAADLDDFVDRLNHAFGDMDARRLNEAEIGINYTYCTCDLVKNGYVTDPKLCLCSLKSLQYNWETVLGPGRVACRMEQSILRGDAHCRFIVKLL